jgi:DNA-binding CsgD family transcriptional regulator
VADGPLAEGQAALAAGDWAAARDAFEAAGESAEALAGLGTALMWLGETDAAVRAREQAYAAFRRRPDELQAAVTALSLYFLFRSSLGNVAASRGWLARAARLADELELPPLTGWVVLARAHDSDDPASAERLAREACDAARATGDRDLDLCALSQLGIALVDLGRVEEGAALLDEAMAASLGGEGEQIQTVVYTSCNMIMACSRAAQFDRATQWIRAAGPFTRRYGSPHVYVLCRLHHGKVLLSTGDWAAAEAELEEALQGSQTTEPSLTAETLTALAELRLAQNRIEEAAGLLAGVADHPAATPIVAALHLARDEPAAAEAILRRRLRAVGDDRLASAPLLELLALVEHRDGRHAEAQATAGRLSVLAARTGCAAIVARAERTLGAVTGDLAPLERALERFLALEMPFEAARTHLLLARALGGDAAVAAARTALAKFEALGATRDADAAAAFLRSLGQRAARGGPRGGGTLTKREREVLALLGEGLTNRAIADRLFVTQKTAQHHVAAVLFKLDLANRAQAAAYAVRELHEREHA